ncbi:MAG TPA: M4 family metallopeptidase, partial [Ignavibacteriales bacterium]|nr:M4 family metallopeptidase [Ignavibacteriales bacterium]
HGRKAIDGKGTTVMSIIHVGEDGGGMDNAYWNGAFMIYGDGDKAFTPLAKSLDAAAHEMSHGITQHTVGLEYKNQSGALNESISDIFGSMLDRDDWLIGEDVTKTSYIPTGALRDMKDPHNGGSAFGDRGWQPAHMNEFVNLPIDRDNGGVHVNSGINNRACYLMAEQIGREKTEKIYYRLMDARYLNTQSNFIDMRMAAIQAATDLYGDGSAEVAGVKAAYDGVGIVGNDGSQQDPDLPPVEGKQWVAAVDAESSTLYLVKPVLTGSNDDFIQLTATKVFMGSSCPITVTENGATVIFVDATKNIRIISSDGSGEEALTDNGVWTSVSLSPDGTKLAATTTFIDSSIYIFDLTGEGALYKYKLYTPTSQTEVKNYNVLYADALDWNLTSDYLIYDCYSEIAKTGGEKLSYWSVNVLKIDDGLILNVFPPQADGISIGNPSFGQTNDTYFLFDYIDNNAGTDDIMAANLFTGKINLVEENGSSVGLPRYSTDDRTVVFQRYDNFLEKPTIRKIGMDETKTAPELGGSIEYVQDGYLPLWFAIGSRPVGVEPETQTPSGFNLAQNYPNPFNPSTRINFQLAKAGHVSLKVYDILGKEAASLVDEYMTPGSYNVDFNAGAHGALASGMYIYRLNVGGESISKKMMLIK